MRRLALPGALAAALGVVAVTNVFMLGSAALERRGPVSEVALTERELALPAAVDRDATALFLTLTLGDEPPREVTRAAWARGEPRPRARHSFLSREKLRELGFPPAIDPAAPGAGERFAGLIGRQAFLVLEFDGDASQRHSAEWQRKVDALAEEVARGAASAAKLEDEKALLAVDLAMRSRLVPIDAGRDAQALRGRYRDPRRYLILPGVVDLRLAHPKDGPPVLRTLVRLLAPEVNVAASQRGSIERFLPGGGKRDAARPRTEWPKPVPPRYRAIVAVGRAHEVWLERIEPM